MSKICLIHYADQFYKETHVITAVGAGHPYLLTCAQACHPAIIFASFHTSARTQIPIDLNAAVDYTYSLSENEN